MPPPPGDLYQARLLDPDAPDAQAGWSALRAASPDASPYDHPAYARAAAEAFGFGLKIALAVRGDEPRAGALLYTRRRAGVDALSVPPFTPYTPILAGEGWHPGEIHRSHSPLDALLAALERAYPSAALHLQPGLADVRPFGWRGWAVRPLFTYLVPLGGEDPPHAHWSKNNRRDYLKARDETVLDESPEALREVLALSRASYARHGRPFPAPFEPTRRFAERLHKAGLLRAFTLSLPGREGAQAGLLLLHEGGRAWYWIAGGERGPASTLLVGRVLHRLHAEGAAGMDFVGANTPSIAEFKRRFGSVLTPYYRVQRVRGVRPRLLDWAGRLRQTVRRRR